MKKMIRIMMFFSVVFNLVGCRNEEVKQREFESFVKEYKSKLYMVDDPLNPPTVLEVAESAEPYLTKNEYENLMENRVFGLASNTAKSLNKSVVLEDVIFDKVTMNDDGGTIDCEITLKIKLYDKQSSEIIEKKGQLSILRKSNEGLKVSRDWEERKKVEGEIL